MSSNPLVEASRQLNLQPGQTYRCQVNGRQVVVRMLEDVQPEMMPAPLVESDIMLDPWVEIAGPRDRCSSGCGWSEANFRRRTCRQIPAEDDVKLTTAILARSSIFHIR